jgi:hypothetical protein
VSDLPPHLQPVSQHVQFEPASKIWRRRLIGVAILPLWLALLAAGMIVQDNIRFNRTPLSETDLFVIGALLMGLGVILFILLLTLFARSPVSAMKRDQRAPILYLRSFMSDRVLGERFFNLMMLVFWWNETAERDLARAVREYGPLVAIGRPDEKLPPLGAVRLYADNETWQGVVTRLAHAAQLVILRIGATEGFKWEWSFVRESIDPRKVPVYLPRRDRDHLYGSFVQSVRGSLPSPPPEDPKQATFLAFREDWSSFLIRPEGPPWSAWWRRLMLQGSSAPGTYVALQEAKFTPRRTLRFSAREWTLLAMWSVVSLWVVVALIGSAISMINQARLNKSIIEAVGYKNGPSRCMYSSDNLGGNECWADCDHQKSADPKVSSCFCMYGDSPLFGPICGGRAISNYQSGLPAN